MSSWKSLGGGSLTSTSMAAGAVAAAAIFGWRVARRARRLCARRADSRRPLRRLKRPAAGLARQAQRRRFKLALLKRGLDSPVGRAVTSAAREELKSGRGGIMLGDRH